MLRMSVTLRQVLTIDVPVDILRTLRIEQELYKAAGQNELL
jgi:hypothetical protein